MNQMFPVIDPEALPSVNPRGFVNLLWKQLDHLGLVDWEFFLEQKSLIISRVSKFWF